jgi:predicted AAA+ superfamily ATPase
VHYDENWGLFLKNIFDRTKGHKNILIIATGSSAINLRINPDLSRRVLVEDIYQVKFLRPEIFHFLLELPIEFRQ